MQDGTNSALSNFEVTIIENQQFTKSSLTYFIYD